MHIMLLAAALVTAPLQARPGVHWDSSRPAFDETDIMAKSERVRQAQIQAQRLEMEAGPGLLQPPAAGAKRRAKTPASVKEG